MRVAVYYSNNDIRIEQRPVPQIGPDEILLRVEASGICGSDVMEWYRIHKAPLVLGHEVAGVIAEAGDGVEGFKEGDRVVAAHHVPCNTCHYCLRGQHTVCETLRKTNFDPGGFAEFLRLPSINVRLGTFLIPDALSFEEASFVEPVACVMRAQRLSNIQKGDTVLIMGSGISGLIHIKMARINGAGLIIATDVNEYRLNAARRFGADLVMRAEDYSPEELAKFNNNLLADVVILCTGAVSAFEQALKSVERGGTIMIFSPTTRDATILLPVNRLFWRNDVTLRSSYAGSPQDYREALGLIASGRLAVKDMITHRLGLADTGRGFRLVADAKESIKVIIEPHLDNASG